MTNLHIEGAKIKDIEKFLDCRYFYAQQTKEDKIYYQGACDALIFAGFSIKQDKDGKHTIKEVY